MTASQLRLFCAVSCLLAALSSGCGRSSSSAPSQTLRLSQRNEPADLDPATASLPDEFFIIRAFSEGLVAPATSSFENRESKIENPQVRPAAASHWETSPDGLTVTFHLRPDARWSNGDPVTSADFIASYRRVLTPATAGRKAGLFFAVKNARAFATGTLSEFSAVGFSAPDPHTLVITLERPTPSFLLQAATGPWIPAHPATVAAHGRAWTQPAHFVGNGPFLLAEWRSQQRIVAKKNPAYHSAATVRLNEIQFLRFDSADTEERAYRAGQIDVTMDVPKTKIETYARERSAELHRTPLAETRFLSFNTARPPLDDERVRRALSLVIDRTKIVNRILLGGQQPATRFVPPALRPDASTLSDNPSADADAKAEARRLLAAAGFPDGKNFPRFELTGWSNSPVLEAIQAQWRQELGLECTVALREATVHLAALHEGNYDIAFATTLLDFADGTAALAAFTTGAPDNFPRWHAAGYDRLLAAAAIEPDPSRRTQLLDRAETQLLAEAPVAPLYFNARNWLMSPRVHGWRDDSLWTRDYAGIFLDDP